MISVEFLCKIFFELDFSSIKNDKNHDFSWVLCKIFFKLDFSWIKNDKKHDFSGAFMQN